MEGATDPTGRAPSPVPARPGRPAAAGGSPRGLSDAEAVARHAAGQGNDFRAPTSRRSRWARPSTPASR